MRIVIDLQACQSVGSRFRGIGRYSKSLALAMLRADRGHEFLIALNGGLPDAIEDIRASFDGLLPQDRIVVWDNPCTAQGLAGAAWQERVTEMLREDFLRMLRPDVVHLASLFEGGGGAITSSIGAGSGPPVRTAVTLYDLIPLAMPELYLLDSTSRAWYASKLDALRRADLCLAISDFTRSQAMDMLGLDGARVVNISGSIDPVFRRLPPAPQRDAALAARYGIWRPFVMYTGGFDPRKNIDGLIRAYAALPANVRERRQLVIVGDPPAEIHAVLATLAQSHGLGGDDVRFVGFVPDVDLVGLYNACALYVFPSRCEGFGLPALEAMACGAPVIGADTSSLPEVIGHAESMFDPDSDPAMAGKMLAGLTDQDFRQRLLDHASERAGMFSWDASAGTALDALERLVATTSPAASRVERASGRAAPRAAGVRDDTSVPDAQLRPDEREASGRWQDLARQCEALLDLVGGAPPDAAGWRRLAQAQADNAPAGTGVRQLLVDVTHLSIRDAGTGIQRVVRSILRELPALLPENVRLEPVYFDDQGRCWYARQFCARFFGQPDVALADAIVAARPGDVFLGLDLSAHIVPLHFEQFDRLRRIGVRMIFVVYDMVPLLLPGAINPVTRGMFQQWYESIGVLADGICCISRAVADEYLEWCDQARPVRARPLNVGWFHLGCGLDTTRAAAPDRDPAPRAGNQFLMVGTIEPRKGYVQALDAFEHLWARGTDASLTIVGRTGWLMDAFAERIKAHPEFGHRLHWLDDANDAQLDALYMTSAALLAASEAEGFGLPLVEAASRGLSILARDLPVFREIGEGNARYFSGFDPASLAEAIESWMGDSARGQLPDPTAVQHQDWRASARSLLALALGQDWYASWRPSGRYRFPAADARLRHQVGRLERNAWRTDGTAGFLSYGPYARLLAGQYQLLLQGAWRTAQGEASLEVVTAKGHRCVARVDLKPGVVESGELLAIVPLSLVSDANDLEVRLWVSADVGLDMLGWELVSCDQPDADVPGELDAVVVDAVVAEAVVVDDARTRT